MVVLYLWWLFDISQIFYFCSGRVIFAVVVLCKTKPGRDGLWVGAFQICVRQPHPSFKMAAVTKNRNFFNCPLLL
jgi:hypothetical protein